MLHIIFEFENTPKQNKFWRCWQTEPTIRKNEKPACRNLDVDNEQVALSCQLSFSLTQTLDKSIKSKSEINRDKNLYS